MNRVRQYNHASILSVRPLTRDDLEGLRQRSARTRLKSLRDSHHMVARLLVSGLTFKEVSLQTGYSPTRIGMLKDDPAFQELMARYRAEAHEVWLGKQDLIYDQMVLAKAQSLRLINEKLEDEGSDIPLKTLLPIFDSMADRTGHVKVSASVNANVNYAKSLEAAIARSKPKVIDGEAA